MRTGRGPARWWRRLGSLVAVIAVGLTAACGGGLAGDDDVPVPDSAPPSDMPTPSNGPSVEFLMNTAIYHSGTEADGWYEARLDIYAPTDSGSEDLPVVVMFHGAPGVIEKASLHSVAEATAARGAVVFVPNWGNFRWGTDPGAAREVGLLMSDAAACAVSFAIARAPEYGGDPDRLGLLGNSAGANTAGLTGLRPAEPFEGCAVEQHVVDADALVLWEGDWLLMSQVWDRYGSGLPTVMAGFTLWDWLDGPQPTVIFATTAGGRGLERRCGAEPGVPWLVDRDPTGAFTAQLQATGAFDDGCIDVAEPTTVLASAMRERGFPVHELTLPSSGHSSLREADRDALLDQLFAALG